MASSIRAPWLFYLLTFYIVVQFSWWAFYLIDINQELRDLTLSLAVSDEQSLEIVKDYQRKIRMIIGEGSVFLFFLILGIFILWRNVQRERKLSMLQNNFLLSVTHELKSPIASIRLLLETLIKRKLDGLNKENIINRAISETDRLDVTSDKILLATRVDTEQGNLHFEQLNLSELVSDTAVLFSRTLGSEHQFDISCAPNVFIEGDKQALLSLVSNLIENAVKYSNKGKRISIALNSTNKKAVLEVQDEGIGISAKEINRIFEKFYRIGNEETRGSKGTGLGLYLVKRISDLHRATVEVQSLPESGTSFKVEFEL